MFLMNAVKVYSKDANHLKYSSREIYRLSIVIFNVINILKNKINKKIQYI